MKTLNLEYSKRVAHLFPDAEYQWIEQSKNDYILCGKNTSPYPWSGKRYFAPTLSELLERLPEITINKHETNIYSICYILEDGVKSFKHKSPETACAKMLIYLDKEGVIK